VNAAAVALAGRIARVELAPGEPQVWRIELDEATVVDPDMEASLSSYERMRARRFFFGRDRVAFVTTRATLRRLLGSVTGCDPARLRFRREPHGKPVLLWPRDDVEFNVAHSRGLALVALSRGRRVGVDVERIRDDLPLEMLARRCLTQRELACWTALVPDDRRTAFFRAWTRKEACLKARGDGLSLDPRHVGVGLLPDAPELEPERRRGGRERTPLCVRDLPCDPRFAAALAVEGEPA
jgi:4'-phosphopantetheinyl transferase